MWCQRGRGPRRQEQRFGYDYDQSIDAHGRATADRPQRYDVLLAAGTVLANAEDCRRVGDPSPRWRPAVPSSLCPWMRMRSLLARVWPA